LRKSRYPEKRIYSNFGSHQTHSNLKLYANSDFPEHGLTRRGSGEDQS